MQGFVNHAEEATCKALVPHHLSVCSLTACRLFACDPRDRSVTPSLLPSGPLSCVHRLLVETEDGSQLSLILKTAPRSTDEPARKLATSNKLFERELGFYKCVSWGEQRVSRESCRSRFPGLQSHDDGTHAAGSAARLLLRPG